MKLTTAVLAAGAAASLHRHGRRRPAQAGRAAARRTERGGRRAEPARPAGLHPRRQLPFLASIVMNSDIRRRCWARFGDLRAHEADDKRAEHFTEVLNQTAKAHQEASPQKPDDTGPNPDVMDQATPSPTAVWHQAPGPNRVPASRTTHLY